MHITIDYSKCTSPLDCAKCAQTCKEAVFIMKPIKIEKFRETNSTNYRLYPLYESLCTGCLECINVCPVQAIEIKNISVE